MYTDKLDEGEDKVASLRHKIAGDVVMLYYVKMDTEQLGTEDLQLTDKLENLKSEIIALKSGKMLLMAEKEELSESAGKIANNLLLGDFKDTKEEIEKKISSNEKLDTKLKKLLLHSVIYWINWNIYFYPVYISFTSWIFSVLYNTFQSFDLGLL